MILIFFLKEKDTDYTSMILISLYAFNTFLDMFNISLYDFDISFYDFIIFLKEECHV